MAVGERRWRRTALRPRRDNLADIAAHLLGRRRDAGNRAALPVRNGRGVTDSENLRPAGNAQIGVHLEAPGAIVLGVYQVAAGEAQRPPPRSPSPPRYRRSEWITLAKVSPDK